MYKNANDGKKGIVCVVHSSCAGYLLRKLPSKAKVKRRTQLNGGCLQAVIYVRPGTRKETITIQYFRKRKDR
jgi:hypothetical protein